MFCRYCGKPTDSPVCPECAAVAQAAQAPEAAPVQAPVEVPVAPATEVFNPEELPMDESMMALGTEAPQPKKKKSKKALWISLVAILGVIAILVGLFWSTIALWWNYLTTPADEMLQEAERAALTSYTDTLSKYYGNLLKTPAPTQQNTSATINVEMNDMVANALSELLKSEDVNLSADQLKNITLDLQSAVKDNQAQINLSLKDMVQIQTFMDMTNSVLYLCIPELNKDPLKVDLKAQGVDLSQLTNPGAMLVAQGGVSSLFSAAFYDEQVRAALPSQEEFDAMLDRIVEAALPALTNVEKEQVSVTVDGVSQSQIALTATIDVNTVRSMVGNVLATLQTDATLKKIVTVINDYIYNQSGVNNDLYNSLVEGINDLKNNLNNAIDYQGVINLTTYVNADMDVMGRKISTFGFGGSAETLSYNFVEDGDTSYFEYVLPETPRIAGTVEEADGETTTKLTLPLEGELAVNLLIKESDTKGSIRITPNKQATQMLLDEFSIPSSLITGDLSVEMGYEITGATQGNLSLRVLLGESSLIALSTKAATSTENVQVAPPTNAVDTNDQMSMYYWAYEAVNNLPTLLQKFGLSEEAIESLLYELAGGMF